MPPSSSFLTPKPPPLLRVSESQAISNSSSYISSASSSTSSLFDRLSGASSGCLTELSSPITPSSADFGNGEEESRPPYSPTKEHDRKSFSPPSRLPRLTNASLVNQSTRLDRACSLGLRSSARSYSQNGTPFLSLIPIPLAKNEERRYHPASEDDFDAVAILRNRLERGNPSIAAKRALEIIDGGGRPPAACVREAEAAEAPVKLVVTAPDSPVEDWSSDFDLGDAKDVKVCPEHSPDVNPVIDQLSDSESELDGDWLIAEEIATAHSSVLFPSASDYSLFDEIEQDIVSSPILSESFLKPPPKPVLRPITSISPCSPLILGTPDLSANLEDANSSLSTAMAESTPSPPISSPENVSIDDAEMARIMSTLLSISTRTRQPFTGSPDPDIDVATVMRLEIASTIQSDNPHPHPSQMRSLIGLGVALPAIHPPLPPTLFPYHHPPGTTLNSRSLQDLGYQTFDDKMFEFEQITLAALSRNTNQPSLSEKYPSEPDFEIYESLRYSPLGGCTAPTPLQPDVDFECGEQVLSPALTALKHTSPIVFGRALVGLGLELTEASVESHPASAQLSPTTAGHNLVSADESVTEGDVVLPPASEIYPQVQNSLTIEPLGIQKTIELDESLLERQSALYNLEHTDLLLDHIFAYSPPIQIEKRSELEPQLRARLSEAKNLHNPQRHVHNIPFASPVLLQDYDDPCTLTTNKVVDAEKYPRSVKQSAVSDERSEKSYKTLKKLGLERLAAFQARSGRNDLYLTSPTVTPQDDPRSPCLSKLGRVFLTFTSLKPQSSIRFHKKSATVSTGLNITQSSADILPMDKELVTHPGSEDLSKSNKKMQIGLGLPSEVVSRPLRREETPSQGSIDTVQSQSRRSSQAYENPSLVVTEPSFSSSCDKVQSVDVPNHFLKPTHFPQRQLYDIVEVPTPPSSTFYSPRGMVSPRNYWSSPFTRLNPPQKKSSSRSQLSTPSTGSPLAASSVDGDAKAEVEVTNVVPSPVILSPVILSPVILSPEVPVIPVASTRPGFKKIMSKFTRGLFKRSRPSLKTSDLLSSPVLVEHADVPSGLGILSHGASCGTKENGFTSFGHKLQLRVLF